MHFFGFFKAVSRILVSRKQRHRVFALHLAVQADLHCIRLGREVYCFDDYLVFGITCDRCKGGTGRYCNLLLQLPVQEQSNLFLVRLIAEPVIGSGTNGYGKVLCQLFVLQETNSSKEQWFP